MASKPCLPVSKKRRADDSSSAGGGDIQFDDWETIDAQTYLSRVVAQGNRLPEIFTAPTEPAPAAPTTTSPASSKSKQRKHTTASSSAASLAYLLSSSASLTPPPSTDVLPAFPRAWVDACCADFEQLRDYMAKLKAHLGKERRFPHVLPPRKDRAAWHVFCVGEAEAQGNVGNYFDDDDDNEEEMNGKGEQEDGDEESSSSAAEEEEWRQHVPATGYPPNTSLLLQMDQVMVRHIISHFAYYSQQGWEMTPNRAGWSYALLARLETPLHREEGVVLYDWLKVLTAQRAKSSLKKETLASLNIIIMIVAIYLEQGGGFAATMQVPPDAHAGTVEKPE